MISTLAVRQQAPLAFGDHQPWWHLGNNLPRVLFERVQFAAKCLEFCNLLIDPRALGGDDLQNLLGIRHTLQREGAARQTLDLRQR